MKYLITALFAITCLIAIPSVSLAHGSVFVGSHYRSAPYSFGWGWGFSGYVGPNYRSRTPGYHSIMDHEARRIAREERVKAYRKKLADQKKWLKEYKKQFYPQPNKD